MDHREQHPYEDMLHLPHHTSATRPRMSALDRAAQFSPFAALTGYDAVIQETARLTERPLELDESRKEVLDDKLRKLHDLVEEQPEVAVTYFEPDERKAGGAYIRITGKVGKIDENKQLVLLTDGTTLHFGQIYEIESLVLD